MVSDRESIGPGKTTTQKGDVTMSMLPETVSKVWESREGPAVFTTVSADGIANSVYVSCVHKFSEDKLVIADNFFDKTRANILAGSKGVLLFLTKEGKSVQVKGTVDYQTSGEVYDDMKNNWLDAKYPGHAAAILNVEEVFSGAEKLL